MVRVPRPLALSWDPEGREGGAVHVQEKPPKPRLPYKRPEDGRAEPLKSRFLSHGLHHPQYPLGPPAVDCRNKSLHLFLILNKIRNKLSTGLNSSAS